MASVSSPYPLSDAAHGAKFAAFIFATSGRPITTPSLGPDSFSLHVAVSRCRYHLDEHFVAHSLSVILGGCEDSFNVSTIEG